MPSVRVMNWMSETVRARVMAMGVPAYAAQWGLEIAQEMAADNVKFDMPGCGHVIMTFTLSSQLAVTVSADLDKPETFTPETQQIHVRAMKDALQNKSHQLRAAAAAKPELGAKPN
jgi:hypothetical protein